MSNLRITEFIGLGASKNDDIQAAQVCPPNAQQVVAITSSSTPSAPFSPHTRLVRLHAEAICDVNFGSPAISGTPATTPTAVAGQNIRLLAGQTEYFGVAAGAMLAVIADT